LTQWLADARQALQNLMTGAAVVELIADGYVTKFKAADADKLRAYIAQLEQKIAGRDRATGIGVIF
jgi:hypothetical protein